MGVCLAICPQTFRRPDGAEPSVLRLRNRAEQRELRCRFADFYALFARCFPQDGIVRRFVRSDRLTAHPDSATRRLHARTMKP